MFIDGFVFFVHLCVFERGCLESIVKGNVSQTIFLAETPKLIVHVPGSPAYKNKKGNCKETVVSARRLL